MAGNILIRGCGGCPALGATERLLLWSARRVAMIGLGCTEVDAAFAETYGAGGGEAAARFKALLAVTAAAAARHISVGMPCRRCVTHDEIALLALIDAAGCGDFALAHSLLGRFAKPNHIDALAHAAEQVAEALMKVDAKVKARHLLARAERAAAPGQA